MKVRTVLLMTLSALWMVFIFIMSAQPREVSSDVSKSVTAVIVDVIYGDDKPLTAEEAGLTFAHEEYKSDVEHGLVPKNDILGRSRFWFKSDIRKLAHLMQFFILAVLINLTFISHYGRNRFVFVAVSLGISCAYGSLDELHQMFVPGRGAMMTDVFLDCIGAACGCLALLLVYAALKLIKRIIHGNGTTA